MDVSESAIACAAENTRRNGLSNVVEYKAANVFDLLPGLRNGEYDYIILDPPLLPSPERLWTCGEAIRRSITGP